MPTVSVIIPMFNSAPTVAETIDSLRAQTLEDWEAVVVNDGSTDDGAAIVDEFIRSDPRIRIVHQKNRGLAGARNTGLAHAGGDFLAFLDADDWFTPDALATLHAAAAGSEHGAAYGGYSHFDEQGAPLNFTSEPTCPLATYDRFLEHNRFPVHGQLIARSTLAGLTFREHLPVVEDFDLWLRLAERGVTWHAVSSTVARYRLRRASLSKRFAVMFRFVRAILRESYGRGRAMGWAARGVDVSDDRLRRVIHRFAIEATTPAALVDPTPSKDAAARLLLESGPELEVTPEAAAAAAYWSLPIAECLAPSAWSGPALARFIPAVRAWWTRIELEGWAEQGFVQAARGRLAQWLVPHDEVVGHLADRASAAARRNAPVVLLGLGRNGTRLAAALQSRAISFTARDDALPAGAPSIPGITGDASSSVAVRCGRVLPADEPWDPHALYLMTLEQDESYLRRIPIGLSMTRWSAVRAELAATASSRIDRAWHEAPPRRTAA